MAYFVKHLALWSLITSYHVVNDLTTVISELLIRTVKNLSYIKNLWHVLFIKKLFIVPKN